MSYFLNLAHSHGITTVGPFEATHIAAAFEVVLREIAGMEFTIPTVTTEPISLTPPHDPLSFLASECDAELNVRSFTTNHGEETS